MDILLKNIVGHKVLIKSKNTLAESMEKKPHSGELLRRVELFNYSAYMQINVYGALHRLIEQDPSLQSLQSKYKEKKWKWKQDYVSEHLTVLSLNTI